MPGNAIFFSSSNAPFPLYMHCILCKNHHPFCFIEGGIVLQKIMDSVGKLLSSNILFLAMCFGFFACKMEIIIIHFYKD